jgi:hypothetical protein
MDTTSSASRCYFSRSSVAADEDLSEEGTYAAVVG